MSMSERFRALGQALAAFDPDQSRLTRGALGKVFTSPAQTPMILRHVWPDLLANEAARALIDRSEFASLRSIAPANGSYWIGYYQGLAGNWMTPDPGGELAERIRAARESAGLTQQQLADAIGSGKMAVSEAERGVRVPSLEWLHRAAVALKCRPSDLDPRLTDRAG